MKIKNRYIEVSRQYMIFTYSVCFVFLAIQACSNDVGLCEFNQWGDWGQCSGTCYAATQTRFRGLCCEQLEPFGTCAQKCNRTIDEAIQTRNCLICNNGGVFVEELMMCVCINGYSGPCCDEYCKSIITTLQYIH